MYFQLGSMKYDHLRIYSISICIVEEEERQYVSLLILPIMRYSQALIPPSPIVIQPTNLSDASQSRTPKLS